MTGANRSMPASAVIPVLAYPDVREAVAWLCRAFGFVERLRIGDENAQRASARIVSPPADPAHGERQYTAIDPAGHVRTFSQTIAVVDPADRGGVLCR